MKASSASLSFAAAAAVFALSTATIPVTASAAEAKDATPVHCYGVNSCKGHSDCKTAKNECKGQNECKGHGFKSLTAQACTAQGGSLTEK